MKNDNSTFSEERLNKITSDARRDGAIRLWDLIVIMADEATYNDIVFELWDIFDLNSDEYKSPKEIYRDGRLDKNDNFKFKGDRAGVWWHIWRRLAKTGGGEQFHSRNLPKIVSPITLYYDDGGGLRRVRGGNERKDGHFVKLYDLANYLKNIEKHYGLSIPLPTRLFPDDERKDSISRKRSSQIHTHNVFPCPEGTTWKDVAMTLVAEDMFRVETPHGKGRYTYHDLKLSDKRAGDKPTMLWVLLKLFAKYNGLIHSENYPYDRKLPDTAKRLSYHLQKLFGIEESIYQAHYRKEKAYRTKINFKDETF